MKVKDVRLSILGEDHRWKSISVRDQNKDHVFLIHWGLYSFRRRTKAQAIAIAKRLCDRFNAGQEGK